MSPAANGLQLQICRRCTIIRLLHVEWFGNVSMPRINVLSIQRISAEDRAKIEAVDPAIELTDAGGWYDGEIR